MAIWWAGATIDRRGVPREETVCGSRIALETKVDENIIGGFVIQTGDQLIDASIAYDLKAIARQFENNDFIYKLR